MKKIVAVALAASVLACAIPSYSQTPCAEGRTAGGQCVNAQLAEAMRQRALVFSQSQVSQTAFPILPVEDFTYRYPNELNPTPPKPAAAGR